MNGRRYNHEVARGESEDSRMTRARQNRNVRIIVPRSGLYVAGACAELNVKNVCNVSNRVLLLENRRKKSEIR